MSARILIVDDTLPSIKVLGAKLSSEYYEVLTASSGQAALEAVSELNPDLILLDVMMPGLDGFDVCRRIKSNPASSHIPVIMVTALSDRTDRVRGLEAGADDFLTKPVSDAMLFTRIHSLVRMKQLLDQWRLREETSIKLGLPHSRYIDIAESTGEARIILVDGSPIENSNILQALAQDNDQITILDSGPDFLDQVGEIEPELVIISITHGNGEALRLSSQLRSLDLTRLTPILLIGGEENMDQFLKGLDLGVSDFIVRPIDELELLARIRTQVRRKRYQDRLQADFEHNLSLAFIDSLTSLHNRRYLETHLEAVVQRQVDNGKPLCLLIIDIDHFKQTNDTHGHTIGDNVLCEVAQHIARNVRGFDLVARYGGEEFVVVMPDTTMEVAAGVAERLRIKIADLPLTDFNIPTTVSIGIAFAGNDSTTPESLIKKADVALYQAKNEGRNKVIPQPKMSATPSWVAKF